MRMFLLACAAVALIAVWGLRGPRTRPAPQRRRGLRPEGLHPRHRDAMPDPNGFLASQHKPAGGATSRPGGTGAAPPGKTSDAGAGQATPVR